jgi:hypothetical protein
VAKINLVALPFQDLNVCITLLEHQLMLANAPHARVIVTDPTLQPAPDPLDPATMIGQPIMYEGLDENQLPPGFHRGVVRTS